MKDDIQFQATLPPGVYDYLKQFQREQSTREGRHLTRDEALTLILCEHMHRAAANQQQQKQ